MGSRKQFTGIVISDKMKKTVVVRIKTLAKHAKYARIIRQYKKFKAHDERGIAKMSDTVLIEECRPISKEKFFRVIEVVKKAQGVHLQVKEVVE